MLNERAIAKRQSPVFYSAAETFCKISQRVRRPRPVIVVGQITTLGVVIATPTSQTTSPATPIGLVWQREVAILSTLTKLLDSPQVVVKALSGTRPRSEGLLTIMTWQLASLTSLVVTGLWLHTSRGAARNMAFSPRTPPSRPPLYVIASSRRPISVTTIAASPASACGLRPFVCVLLAITPPITQAPPGITCVRSLLTKSLTSTMGLFGAASELLRPEASPISVTPRLTSVILPRTSKSSACIWPTKQGQTAGMAPALLSPLPCRKLSKPVTRRRETIQAHIPCGMAVGRITTRRPYATKTSPAKRLTTPVVRRCTPRRRPALALSRGPAQVIRQRPLPIAMRLAIVACVSSEGIAPRPLLVVAAPCPLTRV